MITKSNCHSVPQIHYLAQLTAAQIRSLDRDKTVVLIPGGILEEHGPYLPCFTDGFFNEHLTCAIANAVVSRSGWTALIFPTIPLGTGGANEIGEKFVFPGTYTVRTTTLRAIFMDLATELGEQGFHWIFIMHFHGAPNHNRVLDQACTYFNDNYEGRMVNLAGLIMTPLSAADFMSAEDQKATGFDVHAGTFETSWMLYIQPDLLDPAYKEAVALRGKDWNDLIQIAQAPDWPGYFSSPANSKASYGKIIFEKVAKEVTGIVDQVLDKGDLTSFPNYAEIMGKSESNIAIDSTALAEELRREQKQNKWLSKHGLR